MSSKSLFSFLFLLVLLFSSYSDTAAWIKSGFWYAGSEFPVPELPSTMFTHLHFAFAYINTSSFELYISHSDEPYVSTFSETVKQNNPSVISLLSIWGGRDQSPDFFAMTSEFSHRKSFIRTSIKTARQYGFQGLDLFGVAPDTASNMTNMRIFIEEWRTAINSESENSLILTMGAYYSPMLDSMTYPVDTIVKIFDWVHLIAYGYYLPTKDNFTGAHAALYDPASKRNTDYGIKEWIKSGLPANKIVLGLAYHGYAWTLVNPNHNTVGSPARGRAITRDGSMSYRFIKRYMKSSYGATPVYNSYNSTYVVNYVTIRSFWIGYDDVEAIRTKVSYAKEKGLLGFATFQIPSDDADWELSKAASDEKEGEDQHRSKRRRFKLYASARRSQNPKHKYIGNGVTGWLAMCAPALLYDKSRNISTSYGISAWKQNGVPSKQLVFGVPFYGNTWELKDPNYHGISAPAVGVGPGTQGEMSYDDIVMFNSENNATIGYNNETVSTYSYAGKIGLDMMILIP